MLPLISVIFPVYNVEEWVEESLASVCSQTYENLEIVVINDGSTDGSAAICSRMAEGNVQSLAHFHSSIA